VVVPVDSAADGAESEKPCEEKSRQKQSNQEPLMPFELFHSVTKNGTGALAVTITCLSRKESDSPEGAQ
jgi:hypothetical protein